MCFHSMLFRFTDKEHRSAYDGIVIVVCFFLRFATHFDYGINDSLDFI